MYFSSAARLPGGRWCRIMRPFIMPHITRSSAESIRRFRKSLHASAAPLLRRLWNIGVGEGKMGAHLREQIRGMRALNSRSRKRAPPALAMPAGGRIGSPKPDPERRATEKPPSSSCGRAGQYRAPRREESARRPSARARPRRAGSARLRARIAAPSRMPPSGNMPTMRPFFRRLERGLHRGAIHVVAVGGKSADSLK